MLTLDGEVTQEDVYTLELLTDQVYQVFKLTVESKRFEYAKWLKGIYDAASKYFLAAYINLDSGVAEERNSSRAGILEKYIHHYILMDRAVSGLSTWIMQDALTEKPTDRTEEELLQALQDKSIPYPTIWDIVNDLVEAKRFGTIMNCLDYVRDNYSKPTIE